MLDLESLPPALNPDQIRKRQESFKALQQAVAEHKPLLDKLVKAGGALLKLVGNDEGRKLAEIIDADVDRFENIKVRVTTDALPPRVSGAFPRALGVFVIVVLVNSTI